MSETNQMPDEDNQAFVDLNENLELLTKTTRRLRWYSQIILISSLMSTMGVILAWLVRRTYFFNFVADGGVMLPLFVIFLTLLISSAVTAFFSTVLYEACRRRGDVLFEEISDELQWRIPPQAPTGLKSRIDSSVAAMRPHLNVRITLRTYAKTTDLPLFPGKFGPGLYFIYNVIVLVIGAAFV
jgi:hypothetical protein